MIKEIRGDLLDMLENGTINILCHQANCNSTFGAGIAHQIAQRFPKAYEEDKNFVTKGRIATPSERLGNFSACFLSQNPLKAIFNLYGQYSASSKIRATNYEAIYSAMEKVSILLKNEKHTLGFPKFMSSAIAGGDWRIVRAMIEVVFENYCGDVIIVDWNKR